MPDFWYNLTRKAADDQLIARLNEKAVQQGVKEKYPPISLETVRVCEKYFGFKLPPLLRRVYTEVANGGVGPGGKLIGLADGKRCLFNENYAFDLLGIYDVFINYKLGWDEQDDWGQYLWQWPIGLLPICDWGGYDITVLNCKMQKAPAMHLNYQASINYNDAFKRKTSGVFNLPGTPLRLWLQDSIEGNDANQFPQDREQKKLRVELGWIKTEPTEGILLPPKPIWQFIDGRVRDW